MHLALFFHKTSKILRNELLCEPVARLTWDIHTKGYQKMQTMGKIQLITLYNQFWKNVICGFFMPKILNKICLTDLVCHAARHTIQSLLLLQHDVEPPKLSLNLSATTAVQCTSTILTLQCVQCHQTFRNVSKMNRIVFSILFLARCSTSASYL